MSAAAQALRIPFLLWRPDLALTPHQTDALIREVDDAVRQDELLSFWTRYGRAVIALVILGLAAFAGWLFWQNHVQKRAEANSEQFATFLKSAQGARIDQQAYDKIVADGGAAYKAEAQLAKAALAAGTNDVRGAIAGYDAIIADPNALQPMKDAALVRKIALQFDQLQPQQAIDALKTLAVPGNPWFGSAGELTAIALLRMGKNREAGTLMGNIANDPGVPESIKLRAVQIASMLASGVTLPPISTQAPAPAAPGGQTPPPATQGAR